MATPTELAREAKQHSEILRTEFELLKHEVSRFELQRLREQVAVPDGHVAELKRSKDEGDKRGWQFASIVAGAAAFRSSVVVQRGLFWLKK